MLLINQSRKQINQSSTNLKMRILGISPNTRGIGFAVLEYDNKLIDWGVKYLPHRRKVLPQSKPVCKFNERNQKNTNYLRVAENLINFYVPDIVVFEDWTARTSKRSDRFKRLLYQISLLVTKLKLPSHGYSRFQLQKHFADYKIKTKHEIATFLTHLFPELLPLLPEKRKPWVSEDARMNIFVALSFCVIQHDKW